MGINKKGEEKMLGQLSKKMWYRLISLVVTATFVFSNIATAGVVSTFKLRNSAAKTDNAVIGGDTETTLAIKKAIQSQTGPNPVKNGDLILMKENQGFLSFLAKFSPEAYFWASAINNETEHGNNYDKDGNLIKTKANLLATNAIAQQVLALYELYLIQHGLTNTPLENIPLLRNVRIKNAHVGTNWQNIAWEVINKLAKTTHPKLQSLVDRMIDRLIEREIAAENKSGKKSKYGVYQRVGAEPKKLEQLIGKELKFLIGEFNNEWINLPEDVKQEITKATKENAVAHFKAFGSEGTADLVNNYLKSGLIVPVQKSTAFNIGYEPVRPVVDDFSLQITGATAAVLTVKGLRGKAIELVIKKETLEKEVKEEKDKSIVDMKKKEISALKKQIDVIKDEADAAAKEIFQEVVNREKIILIARVSEGFGRDALKASFKAGDVVIPISLKDEEAAIIKAAIEQGLDEYTSKDGKTYRIEFGIMDVIEGTNPFVDNVKGKSTAELKEKESGATSIMLYGPGVKKFMNNTLDAYIHQIVTRVPPERLPEFIANPLDPESIADGDINKIEEMLGRVAKANGITIGDLEVVIMARDREEKTIKAITDLQLKHKGLTLTTIKDGTVAHGVDAILGIKGRAKHKVMMTVVGAPEGEYIRAIASIYKKLGAVVYNRLVSENVNKTVDGKDAKDLKRRYAFSEKAKEEEEESEVDAIKKAYPDEWQDIIAGKKLYMHSEIGASIRGAMAYISNNGVFRQDGVKVTDQGSEVNFLRFGWVNGRPCAWYDEKRLIDNEGNVLDPVPAEVASVSDFASYPGNWVWPALADTDKVIMATNIRTPLSIDGIIEAAIETGSFVVFQKAMSEMDYTFEGGYSLENPAKFEKMIKERCKAYGFKNFMIKGDHITVKAEKEFLKNKQAQAKVADIFKELLQEKDIAKREELLNNKIKELEGLAAPDKDVIGALKAAKKGYDLLKAELKADHTEFALDASFMPTELNVLISTFLTGLVNSDIGVEAEQGEIGGEVNSTVADVVEFLTGRRYAEKTFVKGGAQFSKLLKYGPAVPIIDELSSDIGLDVSKDIAIAHIKGEKAIPIVINYADFFESGPDGAMSLENVLTQLSEKKKELLGKGEVSKDNIKFILDIPDGINPAEVDKVLDKFFAKINEINGDFTNISRDAFSEIVAGKNSAEVAAFVKAKFGVNIFAVIGSKGYVNQFNDSKGRIALGESKSGEIVSMAKAIKLALNLILGDGKISEQGLTQLDQLFTQDSKGYFEVKPYKMSSTVAKVEEYKAEVAAAIAI